MINSLTITGVYAGCENKRKGRDGEGMVLLLVCQLRNDDVKDSMAFLCGGIIDLCE